MLPGPADKDGDVAHAIQEGTKWVPAIVFFWAPTDENGKPIPHRMDYLSSFDEEKDALKAAAEHLK